LKNHPAVTFLSLLNVTTEGHHARVTARGPAQASMAELVLHISREMLYHGAEIALLRDLYFWHDGRAAMSL
jgi:hypothetical protein